MKTLLILVVALLLGAGTAVACTCMEPGPPLEALGESAAVFSGKVVRIDEVAGPFEELRVRLRVRESWKGNVGAAVVVLTSASSASCGYTFREGASYLVYARRGEFEQLHVSLCSRTRPLREAEEDLEALGEGTRPPDGRPEGCAGILVALGLALGPGTRKRHA